MKSLNWNRSIAQLKNTVAVMLGLVMLAMTPMAVAADQMTGRDFNHMATGFPLTGGHAAADCASCHVGGLFKGTPRNCDGCHAMGRRVIATPKSARHLVTNDPCEVCHTNTVTFLGALFNHATVTPGSCNNCHNGFNAAGRPSNHNTTARMTPCDNCHRTVAWLPIHYSHIGVIGECGTCHMAGGNVAPTPVSPIHQFPQIVAQTIKCSQCHPPYNFAIHRYDHVGAGATCATCHTTANQALYGIPGPMPAGHISYTAPDCVNCHTSLGSFLTVVPSTQIHAFVTATPCTACHLSSAQCNGNGQVASAPCRGTMQKVSHNRGQDCIGCHTNQYTRWNNP